MKYFIPNHIKYCFLIGLVVSGHCAQAQKTFFYPPLKWSINIPAGFASLPANELEEMGKEAFFILGAPQQSNFEKNLDIILAVSSDQYHYIDAKAIPCDRAKFDAVVLDWKKTNILLYHSMQSSFPKLNLDSAYYKELVGGLIFDAFKIEVTFDVKNTLSLYSHVIHLDNKVFAINVVALDPNKRQEMLSAVRNSTFGKN